MNYIGSKFRLLPFLYEHISKSLEKRHLRLQDCVFADIFAGTCAVSKFFKNKVKRIIANDKEFYSFVLAKNYIQNSTPLKQSAELIHILNNAIPLIKGKIYTHYALGGGENRQYFSDNNAIKIDSIRTQISLWKKENFINDAQYYFLLASLLESADKVANTASVYGAFLKSLKKSACKDLDLKAALFELSANSHQAFNQNVEDLIENITADILYLDPPYNTREYGANYHLLNSIALYDDFIPQGKTGLRIYEKSAWCKRNLVESALAELIEKAKVKFVFLSYNDEGLLHLEQIAQIFKKYGKYSFKTQIHNRFKADSQRIQKQQKTLEYLHILEKN